MKYKLVSGRHSRTEGDGVRKSYGPGDPIELTAAEAKSAGARVVPWPETVSAPQGTSSVPADLVEEVAGKTIAQIVDLLADLTTKDDVEALQAAELEGHARKGVLKACAERLEELGGAS